MPQEFCVVQCAGCHAFQVQQVKKKKEFTCPVCHKKQSVLKCFAIGHSAKDCRLYVSQLNEARGRAEAQEPAQRLPLQAQQQQQQQAATVPGPSTTWEQFVGTDEDEPAIAQPHEEQDAGFVTHVPDAVKGGRQGRGSTASTRAGQPAAGRKRSAMASTEEDDGHIPVHAHSSKSRCMGSAHVAQRQQQQVKEPMHQRHTQQPRQSLPSSAPLSNSGQGVVGRPQAQALLVKQQHLLQQQRAQVSQLAASRLPVGTLAAGGTGLQYGPIQQQQQLGRVADMPPHAAVPQLQRQWQQPALQGAQQHPTQRAAPQQASYQQHQPLHQPLHQPHIHKPAAAHAPAGAWSAFMLGDGSDFDGCSSDDDYTDVKHAVAAAHPAHSHAARRWGAEAGGGQQQQQQQGQAAGGSAFINKHGWLVATTPA